MNAKHTIPAPNFRQRHLYRTATLLAVIIVVFCMVPAFADGDADGIADPADRCPHSNANARTDIYGCEHDQDGDGVVDAHDQCPSSIPGSPVNIRGCNHDSDGDLIEDFRDQCAATSSGARVDAQGCELGSEIHLAGLVFSKGSSTLNNRAKNLLRQAANTLLKYPELKVEVAGYTDSRGNDENNRKLSQQRADSVRRYLIAQGVAASRVRAQGYGENNPIASNRTAAGRASNRRVVLNLASR